MEKVNKPTPRLRTNVKEVTGKTPQEKSLTITAPLLFVAVTIALLSFAKWPLRWLLSGTPILTFCILFGASRGYRILPFIHLWTLVATLNLAYAVAGTSWLLYGFFTAACYPAIFLTCIFQFNTPAFIMRRALRRVLKELHFVNDKIAFFDIPALEIDVEVNGLMVIRGVSISLSSLMVVAHGVEVGIKLSDDMELAIQTERVEIRLFRNITISDCFVNLKGGEKEMTFGSLDLNSQDSDGNSVMVSDTPLLKVAAANGLLNVARPEMIRMTSRMTRGDAPEPASPTKLSSVFQRVKKTSPDDAYAREYYEKTLDWIQQTSIINQAHRRITQRSVNGVSSTDFDRTNENDMRAAICSSLHNKPSVPHPPKMSVKVTTLKNMSSARMKVFTHRLPMLLRLLLNPLSYFHPVSINSITAAGSGKWITTMLQQHIFMHYGEESAEIRRLEERISAWLSDANFVFGMGGISGVAQVPFISSYDIVCLLGIEDVMAYRTLPEETQLKQVIRIGGADASFTIPSYLLPHHEHLLPPVPSQKDRAEIKQEAKRADGLPKTVQKEYELEQAEKDECNVKISAHAKLPACFDQELLNFIAALVKATKVVELEKEENPMDREVTNVKDFFGNVNKSMKDGMKKAMVDGVVNDRWIAKLVGKITKKLETAQGDIGYTGNLPVALGPYRLPEGSPEASKILA